MQKANVMIVGEAKSVELVQASKYLNKLYVTTPQKIQGALNIKFNTFRELAQKCKALQIDIVVVEEEKWIQQGIIDVLSQNYINCIGATAKWAELGLYNKSCRAILEKYSIDVPKKIVLPVSFPIIVKADGITKKANNMQEIIDLRQEIFNRSAEIGKTIYLEEYIEGEKYDVVSLFDGETLITFPHAQIQNELLKDYTKKLENMLKKEGAHFAGFINSKLMQRDNKLLNVGFNFEFNKPNMDIDFLFLLNSAIYQKLNEIEIINHTNKQ